MITIILAMSAIVGALLGAVGVIVLDVSLIGGVGIYLGVTMCMTGIAMFFMLRGAQTEPEALRPDLV